MMKSIFRPYRNIPVLLYHQIDDTTPQNDRLRLGVSPRTFDAQMKYMYDNGYRTIGLDEHLKAAVRPEPPEKVFVITFDDGYLDNYANAFPVLMKYGFTATIFIVSGFMGSSHAWDGCEHVKYMEWSHAREMQGYGIEFANHTRSHPDLTELGADRLDEEISGASRDIEDRLGAPVRSISYPFGRYNPAVIDAVIKSGMESAYSVGTTQWHRYSLERFMITSKDSAGLFRIKAGGRASWIRSIYKRVGGGQKWSMYPSLS